MKALIDRLEQEKRLTGEQWVQLIEHRTPELAEDLFQKARRVRETIYGKAVYTRGLIEFTNYCKCNCLYCGIRRSNQKALRYRLTQDEILSCCREGYGLGFRTFVLQGGEDGSYSDDLLCRTIEAIKKEHPDCAVTLSLGEKPRSSYQAYFSAGADRYLLRHETATASHYKRLHPPDQTLERRMDCLWALKEIGYQVGTGFMVGSPHQTAAHLAEDLLFIKALSPHMVGIGPFLPHGDTPFGSEPGGSVELTLFLLGALRLMLPHVLLPATTALGTADRDGREKGVLAGANVVMPNLSPVSVRQKYLLYDNKICTDEESAEGLASLKRKMDSIGYHLTVDRGDCKLQPNNSIQSDGEGI